MTCSNFVNALKMLICSEKHPVSRTNYGCTKKVVRDRWASVLTGDIMSSVYATLSAEQLSSNFDI